MAVWVGDVGGGLGGNGAFSMKVSSFQKDPRFLGSDISKRRGAEDL